MQKVIESASQVRHGDAEILRLTNENAKLLKDICTAQAELKRYRDAATQHAHVLAEEQRRAKEAEENFAAAAEQVETMGADLKKAQDGLVRT